MRLLQKKKKKALMLSYVFTVNLVGKLKCCSLSIRNICKVIRINIHSKVRYFI